MPRGLQIAYTEYIKDGESPIERFDINGGTATRVFDVSWSQRATAVWQLLGFSYIDKTDPLSWELKRYLPDYHPTFPQLIATSVSIRGLGSLGNGADQYESVSGKKIAKYNKARITVEYTTPNYDVLADEEVVTSEYERYRTFQAKPSAEYLSPPAGAWLTWSEGNPNRKFGGNVGFIVGTVDYTWTWLSVPFDGIPFDTLNDTIGKVNKTTFADCAAGTLLLLGADIERVNGPYGLRTWNITYTARYNPRLHNNFYDYERKVFSQATVDGVYQTPGSITNGKCVYDERSFYNLFDVNYP